MALGILFALAQDVEAKNKSEFLPAFEATYPAAVGSRIDSCTICHNVQGSEYELNSYARQWKEDENFVAINNLDADGDGYTNIEEINAHTFPGKASDNPSTVTTTTTVPGATTTTAAPGSGSAIYQAHCASCHGGGGGNLVPTTQSLSQIVNVVSNGIGSMPGYSGSLTSAEIQLVSEYLFNWVPIPTTTTTTLPGTPPPPPPNGSTLYGASCAGCHGANGGDLVGTPLTRSQLVDITTNGTSAGMPGYASTYNAAEIEAIAGYILSLVAAPTTTSTTLPGTPPPPPPSGAAVYSSHCAACHGSFGGDLIGRDISTRRIASVTNSGVPGMPGFSSRLSQAETDAVVAYVAAKVGGTPTTTTTEPGSLPPSGATVYAESCSACHGPSGGDLIGHSLTDSELTSVISQGVGTMPGYASRLSSDQLDAVVAYLSSLSAKATGDTTVDGEDGGINSAALYTRYCSACHGAHGQGGMNGPVAGTSLSLAELIAVTTDGLGSMPGYSSRMAPGEIEAVAAFVLTLGGETSEAAIVPSVSQVTSTGRLYEQLCATCHGADGEGRGSVAPFGDNLDAVGVATMIVNGGSRMPDYPDLSAESLNALVAHTLLLANGEPESADAANEGNAEGLAALAPGTNDPPPSLIDDAQAGGGSDIPTSAFVVVVLGLLGLAGGVGYTRMRASRAVAQ